jgi:aspartate aminotransferase-like enzyme
MPPHVKLFIPGPTEVRPDVLAEMARPIISHRSAELAALQKRISQQAAAIMFTANPVLLSTSSGTGLMEGGIRNGVEKRALSLVCGAFTERWHRLAFDCGKEADKIEVPWGRAIEPGAVDRALATGKYDAVTVAHNETSTGVANPMEELASVMRKYPEVVFMVDTVSSLGGMPLKVDELGIDLCLASVQKALALPPGFSLCSVSPKLMERSRRMKGKGFYFDFARMLDKARLDQPLTTPSVSHMFAMERQFTHILDEGMERRWDRHRRMALTVRGWAKERFALFADEAHASDTLTCVANTRGIKVADLIGALRKEGMLISNGYGDLKEKAFRIAHLGELGPDDIEVLLTAIDRHLGTS